jgi:predicted flap endonuclease-1-like 5' DNA nuclease
MFLVLGILIGWLIEWIIDWIYWRKKGGKDTGKAMKDVLQAVDGIGPVISQKLYDAGINTFEDLGALKPDDLEGIVGESIKNLADEAELIAEAKKFAKIKKEVNK